MDKTAAPITSYWERDEKTVKGEKLNLALRRLQSQAESFIVDAESAVLEAEEAFNKARMTCVKNPDFGAVVEASLELKRAQLTRDEARIIYREQFGTEPKL
ncbi:MAG: hypothetical protein ACXABY_26830 [Candidatus Thorarchaeota archaeon]|jgi:hypothetical protein